MILGRYRFRSLRGLIEAGKLAPISPGRSSPERGGEQRFESPSSHPFVGKAEHTRLVLSALCLLVGFTLSMVPLMVGLGIELGMLDFGFQHPFGFAIGVTFTPLGMFMMYFSVLPTDALIIDRGLRYWVPIYWLTTAAICALLAWSALQGCSRDGWLLCRGGSLGATHDHRMAQPLVSYIYFTAVCLGSVASCAPLFRRAAATGEFELSPPVALQWCWTVARVTFGIMPLGNYSMVAYFLHTDGYDSAVTPVTNVACGLLWWLCVLLSGEPTRRRVRARLQQLALSDETRGAAAIAAVIGGYGRTRALELAQVSFGGVPFNDLRQADFTSGAAMGALRDKVTPLSLGRCDAFLSHSWRDSAPLKWAALKSWAAVFTVRHSRQPTIWLDKACIDQQNIDASLACLPIYLAGCRKLVVIAGETYSTRLWCVMELFIFLKATGGGPSSLERITILPIGRSGASTSGGGDLIGAAAFHKMAVARLQNFDASRAQCFIPEDRQRLLAIIEASYGELDEFNLEVRNAIQNSLANREEHFCARMSSPTPEKVRWLRAMVDGGAELRRPSFLERIRGSMPALL